MSTGETIRAFEARGETTFYVPHPNGEEALVVSMLSDTQFSASWTGIDAADRLLAMGAAEIEVSMPDFVLDHVERRLAEKREPPSVVLHRMLKP